MGVFGRERNKRMNLVKLAMLFAMIAAAAAVGSYPEEKMVEEFAPELELFTKFPDWVKTEDDMEQYFKLQHTKVVRKDTGNGGVNPSGRPFEVEVAKSAPEPELLEVGKARSDAQVKAGAKKLIDERTTSRTKWICMNKLIVWSLDCWFLNVQASHSNTINVLKV